MEYSIALRRFSPILVRIQPHAGGWYCTVLYCTVLYSKFLALNFDGRRVRNVNGNEIKLAGEVGQARPRRCRLLADCTSQICKYSRIVKYKVCECCGVTTERYLCNISPLPLLHSPRISRADKHTPHIGRTVARLKTKQKHFYCQKIFFVRIRVRLCKQKREIAAVLLLPPFVENMLGHPSIVNCV